MSAIQKVLARLEKVRQTGPEKYMACCPAHDDKSPSLSLEDLGDKFLMHCFAGCSNEQVMQSVGLSLNDFFDKSTSQSYQSISTAKVPIEVVTELFGDAFVLLAHDAWIRGGDKLGKEDRDRLYQLADQFRGFTITINSNKDNLPSQLEAGYLSRDVLLNLTIATAFLTSTASAIREAKVLSDEDHNVLAETIVWLRDLAWSVTHG